MARFLFVVPPLVGHTNPTVGVGAALAARGHTVAWAAHPRLAEKLLPAGATVLPLDDRYPEEEWKAAEERARTLRGLPALEFLWREFLVPLARGMRPGVEEALGRFGPDVAIVDQQAIAGALACRRKGVRWATFATTSAGVTDPLAELPKVRAWRDAQLAALEAEAGLPPSPCPDLSPELVVVFSTRELVGPEPLPPQVRFCGPALGGRPADVPFPWEALAPPPARRLFVSLGTVNAEAGERFYPVLFEALGGVPELQVVLVAPERFTAPPGFVVRSFVPQLALLPHVHAVVCHAGHNTVCEALGLGLPLVVLPIKDDQPVVAQQVAAAGAGIRLRFGRVRPAELREAVLRVLSEPSYREAAARIGESFRAAGGAARAAELLEELLPGGKFPGGKFPGGKA